MEEEKYSVSQDELERGQLQNLSSSRNSNLKVYNSSYYYPPYGSNYYLSPPPPPPPPYYSQSPPRPPPPPPSPNSSKSYTVIIVATVVPIVVLLCASACFFIYFRKKKSISTTPSKPASSQSKNFLRNLQNRNCREFSLAEIIEATKNFSDSNEIGKGGFSVVYKGVNPDGQEWAIKRLKKRKLKHDKEPEFPESFKSFVDEVSVISTIHHKHLVRLVGYYSSETERILVYEFMAKGSLRNLLDSDVHISCNQRLEIADGIAQGLNYLHNHTQPQIIHRDIKSDNVLMDNDFKAKITDFGLMKMNENNASAIISRPMGTVGHLDPQYATTGVVTTKSDVYSYGIVLLELITRRHSLVDYGIGNEMNRITLLEWANKSLGANIESISQSQNLGAILDAELMKSIRPKELEAICQLVALAGRCVRRAPNRRPNMNDVCGQINRIIQDMRMDDMTIDIDEEDSSKPIKDYYPSFIQQFSNSVSGYSGTPGPVMSRPYEPR